MRKLMQYKHMDYRVPILVYLVIERELPKFQRPGEKQLAIRN